MRIDDLALLADSRTAALEDREGTITWFSPGRFDAPSVFGRLLGADAGHWTVRPAGELIGRRYAGDGPILETSFRSDEGEARLTDALALAPGAREHRIVGSTHTRIVRRVECVTGSVDVRVDLAARPEYGLTRPHLAPTSGGWRLIGGRQPLELLSPVEHRAEGDRLIASVRLEQGETAEWQLVAGEPDGRDGGAVLDDTMAGWQSWAALHEGLPGPYRAAVQRSSMVLRALTYAPTGVVVAAPTTSLPERIGEGWNWDYRYAWLRDLSFVVHALWVAACPDEPLEYLDWIARALGKLDGEHVQIMFGVEGERDLTEHELTHLEGFRGSRPVRTGNDAWGQRQLDVIGEVLDSAHLLCDYLAEGSGAIVRETLIGLADRAAEGWRDPDFGMWEARDKARHYLSSKVMCWVALDRAVKLADRLDARGRAPSWARERDAVRDAVLHEGWNDDVGAFVGAIGSDRLDASVLLMPLVGIVPGDDPRMVSTLRRIEERLVTEHGVQRWASESNAFVLCGFWLAECLALAGERERAEERFAMTAGCANDLGLLSEEVSLDTGEALGNFPQAISHVGLINAAWRLTPHADD